MLSLVVVVVINLLVLPVLSEDDSLKVVSVLFRHGDRAPVMSYPKDRVNETFWPYGYGELTDRGKEQHYKLGQFFKKRYTNFIKDTFDYREIYVRSSDYDRCLISAYSNLAGLYSNTMNSTLSDLPFMTWQPIPVHTTPLDLDQLLAMDKPCDAVTSEQGRLFDSEIVQTLNQEYQQFFKYVSENTGVDLSQNGVKNMWSIADTLFCESQHNLSLPAWTQAKNFTCNDSKVIPCSGKTVWNILREMQDFQFYIMYNSSTLHKFDGGPLLEDIVSKFKEFTNGSRTIKFNMYSGHDTSVAAVLSALGVFNHKAPQYTATVIIELHSVKDKADVYEVKVFSKNVTDDDSVYQLELPGCESPCLLEDFNKLTDKYKIEDWDLECGNLAPHHGGRHGTLTEEEVIVISVCASAVAVLAFAALICYVRRKRISSSYVAMT